MLVGRHILAPLRNDSGDDVLVTFVRRSVYRVLVSIAHSTTRGTNINAESILLKYRQPKNQYGISTKCRLR